MPLHLLPSSFRLPLITMKQFQPQPPGPPPVQKRWKAERKQEWRKMPSYVYKSKKYNNKWKNNSYYSLQRKKVQFNAWSSHQVSLILQLERLFPKFELRTSQVTRQQHHTISSRLIIPFLSDKSDRNFNTTKLCICNTPHQEKKIANVTVWWKHWGSMDTNSMF